MNADMSCGPAAIRGARGRALVAVRAFFLIMPAAASDASVARVAIEPGILTASNMSIKIARQNPLGLDLSLSVIDARGTGTGWAVLMAGYSPNVPSGSMSVVTGAGAACLPNSTCAPPLNEVTYPAAVSMTGGRTTVFDTEPASGLGAQTITIHLTLPHATPRSLTLSLSLVAQP
jgi:hypothetical protein